MHFCLFCSDPDCECAQLIGVLEEEREVAKVDKSWSINNRAFYVFKDLAIAVDFRHTTPAL